MDWTEMRCAAVATRVIAKAGGSVSWTEYDRLMAGGIEPDGEGGYYRRPPVPLWAPITWCQGWGGLGLLRLNHEKLAVFAAIRLGWVMTHAELPIYHLCRCP